MSLSFLDWTIIGLYLAFALGVVILSLHKCWQGWEAALITAIGWISLIKGMVNPAFPAITLSAGSAFAGNTAMIRASAVIVILLGGVLLWVGFG